MLTLSWRRSLSYRSKSTDLLSNSMDWFLYDRDLRDERLNRRIWKTTILFLFQKHMSSNIWGNHYPRHKREKILVTLNSLSETFLILSLKFLEWVFLDALLICGPCHSKKNKIGQSFAKGVKSKRTDMKTCLPLSTKNQLPLNHPARSSPSGGYLWFLFLEKL